MKLFLLTFLFAVLALATKEQKTSVIVTYDESVPEYIIEQAKDAIRAAGDLITHEYTLIRGFAAVVTKDSIDRVKGLSTEHEPLIEEDGPVHIFDGSS